MPLLLLIIVLHNFSPRTNQGIILRETRKSFVLFIGFCSTFNSVVLSVKMFSTS
uniref:Uncharacterized protein n=1 Tax=Kalanchoe fedtschenkoi TaxID=63787 RepID=A0A7N0RCC0_KALFE